MKKIYPLLLVLLLSFSYSSNSQEELQTRDVITGLDTPWEILWGPDGHIWMTERFGRVSRVDPETGEREILIDIPDVYENFERGLLGMDLHPDFPDSPHVFVVYTYQGGPSGTTERCVRYTYDGEKLDNPKIIIDDIKGWGNHDGSRILISDDYKIFMTTGDAADQTTPQNISSLNGKVLRLNIDGSVPDDNPFPGSYVWSWGHRNPQGLVYANGILYSSEHGPGDNDELNIIHEARNYGWPHVRGYCDREDEAQFCADSNVVEPILSLYPTYTIAVCGIDYYGHTMISEWENSILLVALKGSRLVQIKLDETGQKVVEHNNYFEGEFGRLRDICVSPDGRVFISTSNRDQNGNPRDGDDRIIEISRGISDVDENENRSGMSIYPNPTPSGGAIIFEGLVNIEHIKIFSYTGDLVGEIMDINKSKVLWPSIDGSGYALPSGIYHALIYNGRSYHSYKFVIIR